MNEQNEPLVTRNDRYAELKLLADLLGMAGMIYYLTHPDCFDRAGEKIRSAWQGVIHQVSVWAAQQDIRSLPETDDVTG